MQLQPLADRIVARPVEAETKTAAGILLSEGAKEKTQVAEVVAVGKEVKEVKVGDRVIYSRADYKLLDEIRIKDEDILVLREAAIAAVLKG